MYNFPINCQFDGSTLNKIYEDAFGVDKKDGFFVEIGASNGQDYSNTCGLADAGWSGIYVEPVQELADKCRVRHANNKVKVFTCAAGAIDGEQELYMINSWGTATSNRDAATTIGNASNGFTAFTSKVLRLDSILLVVNAPEYFDLLVIDVDYGEIDVLKGFNIKYWQPKLVIIELHEDNPFQIHSEKIRPYAWDYFANAEYEKIYHDSINTIFRRNV